jgi:hypothetical protein
MKISNDPSQPQKCSIATFVFLICRSHISVRGRHGAGSEGRAAVLQHVLLTCLIANLALFYLNSHYNKFLLLYIQNSFGHVFVTA